MTTETKLRHCDCGAEMEIHYDSPEAVGPGAFGFYLLHPAYEDFPMLWNCPRTHPTEYFDTEEEAIEAWNNFDPAKLRPAEIEWHAEGGSPDRFGRDHEEVITKLAKMVKEMQRVDSLRSA